MNENFSLKQIDEMSGREMFCVERLRTDVFVTEQKITLPELDDQDLDAVQVFLLNEDQTNALAASIAFACASRLSQKSGTRICGFTTFLAQEPIAIPQ